MNIEGQNSFQLQGKSATLAGKPDLIARREDDVAIVDAKTGHESPSHAVQLMIYLYAVPRALERYRNAKLRGKSPTGCPASTIFAGWRQSVLPVHLLGLAPLLGSVGPVAGDVKLQDDGVVHDPVNRRGGGHGVGKDAFPL